MTRSTATREQLSPIETTIPTLTVLAHPDSRRVGELATLPSLSAREDVRLSRIDAELDAILAEGRLSRPLFHRLAGYEIRVPPLRERRADFSRFRRSRGLSSGTQAADEAAAVAMIPSPGNETR